jgi:hypothetical protein
MPRFRRVNAPPAEKHWIPIGILSCLSIGIMTRLRSGQPRNFGSICITQRICSGFLIVRTDCGSSQWMPGIFLGACSWPLTGLRLPLRLRESGGIPPLSDVLIAYTGTSCLYFTIIVIRSEQAMPTKWGRKAGTDYRGPAVRKEPGAQQCCICFRLSG